ncbi:MAG TPA: ribonuclease HII [Thermoplasmatales archaeon]|nr:ribonuclease HII [Thermoplasmatales archaeon]
MICGIDEAGRGPVIGPMVVAGIWMEERDEWKLMEAKVRDSKKLSSQRREKIAEFIKKNFYYEIIVVNAEDIDNLRQIMSLNQLEAFIFAKIASRKYASIYYIDSASANEEEFKKEVKKRIDFDCEIVCEHEADDKYPVVSASSIIAKVERDRLIKNIAEKIEKKIGMPMGSGYPSDKKTVDFIKEWIKKFNELPPHTRKSWRTVRNIQNEMKQGKLI